MAHTPWYLNPAFLPAAFGLIGVIVGGLITAGSAFLLEQRREARQQEKEQRTHDTELRTAARLVELDFRIARACVKNSVRDLEWCDHPREPLTCEHWDTYKAAFASELSLDDWVTLAISVVTISELSYWREQARHQNKMAIGKETAESLQPQMKRIEKGQVILGRLMGLDGRDAALLSNVH